MDYEAYIARLEQECDVVYQLAEQARSKGLTQEPMWRFLVPATLLTELKNS